MFPVNVNGQVFPEKKSRVRDHEVPRGGYLGGQPVGVHAISLWGVYMARFQFVTARPVFVVLGFVFCLSSPLLAQRSDRGVIGGVVTDPQAASLPGATVTVRN